MLNNVSIQHYHRLQQANFFHKMTPVALDILKNMSGDIIQLCGPISTGGYKCKETNIHVFCLVIKYLEGCGYKMFNQIIFEKHIQRIWDATTDGYPTDVLEKFYQVIFEAGIIKHLIFLPSWKSSFGTRWEMRQAVRLKIPTTILSQKEFSFALRDN